ncbi:hypothetical protein DITRI_Ditri02bG0165600 [Diplodiscus trichospermus]
MSKPKDQPPLFGPMALALLVFPGAFLASGKNKNCEISSCGNLTIRYPFRLESQSKCNHTDNRVELKCDNDNRTLWVMNSGNFSVGDIFYSNSTIRLVDVSLNGDNCSLPGSSFSPYGSCYGGIQFYSARSYYYDDDDMVFMYLENCTRPMKSPLYVDASRCTTNSSSYFYFLDENTTTRNFSPFCTTIVDRIPVMMKNITGVSALDIHQKLLMGFYLSWDEPNYYPCREYKTSIFQTILLALGTYIGSFVYLFYYHDLYSYGGVISRTLIGVLCLLALVMYKWRRRHLSMDNTIEEFLQSQNNFLPIRYSFKEIKKMTKGFKDKLGEGGFGSVFKGKLRSGHHVAIKLLDKSKANGQDFINEVASIGRIHHVNVAKLIGFCVEGSKQALVYDFMVNGSLDKIIFSEENKNTLGWKKIFDIVLGIARGIDYLHQGCDMQILHFDIKPHNILLDENFNPKVSDFGLAKLYSVEDSIVSLTVARGTIGYIAPELVYKNIGGISYKADVYSFGMLLMEMIGKRKNLNAFVNHASQIYFPSWIYDRLDQGEDIELGDVTDGEKIMVRKLAVIAFWCIQMMPADRPSMSQVLKMLEIDIELLEMPPKPFYQLPPETSIEIHDCENRIDEPTTSYRL